MRRQGRLDRLHETPVAGLARFRLDGKGEHEKVLGDEGEIGRLGFGQGLVGPEKPVLGEIAAGPGFQVRPVFFQLVIVFIQPLDHVSPAEVEKLPLGRGDKEVFVLVGQPVGNGAGLVGQAVDPGGPKVQIGQVVFDGLGRQLFIRFGDPLGFPVQGPDLLDLRRACAGGPHGPDVAPVVDADQLLAAAQFDFQEVGGLLDGGLLPFAGPLVVMVDEDSAVG